MSGSADDTRFKPGEYGTPEQDEASLRGLGSFVRRRRRVATLYDAVAGKIVDHHTLEDRDSDEEEATSGGEARRPPPRSLPLAPEEVLFRRREAPQRYAEHDIYFSHERDFPEAGRGTLPSSDLLTAIHGYSSRFYSSQERRQAHLIGPSLDFRSMDETALLTLGILLEEAGKEVLGRRGDLVFTEGADSAEEDNRWGRDRSKSTTCDTGLQQSTSPGARRVKRRKT